MKILNELIKKIAFKYTKFGRPTWPYNIEPIQLALLINEIERLKNISGSVVEVGVARGMTTRALVEHIQCQNIDDKNRYVALDTFNSFVKEDLEYEVVNRAKNISDLRGFLYNSHTVWQKNFAKYDFLEAIKADCSIFDFSTISPIKLCFLDVDLYRPTKIALPKIYQETVSGGVIIVDDVKAGEVYDGAYQAYMEFCASNNLKPTIVGNKCGIIRKN